MPPPVMRDDAIATLPEEQHLPIPIVRAQWPAMRKHDRLSLSPVLVENLRAVFGRDSAHIVVSYQAVRRRHRKGTTNHKFVWSAPKLLAESPTPALERKSGSL